jgi:arylsulfatase A-like enzyme
MCRRTRCRRHLRLDWFPTFLDAAGNPNITDQLLKGVKLGDRTYKNHLDGYDQMPAITGKGPSNRHEIFYLGESTVGAVRIDDYKFRFIDQPQGWLGDKTKPDVPYITNLRLDPFERTGCLTPGRKKAAAILIGSSSNSGALCCSAGQEQELQTSRLPADAAGREFQP